MPFRWMGENAMRALGLTTEAVQVGELAITLVIAEQKILQTLKAASFSPAVVDATICAQCASADCVPFDVGALLKSLICSVATGITTVAFSPALIDVELAAGNACTAATLDTAK